MKIIYKSSPWYTRYSETTGIVHEAEIYEYRPASQHSCRLNLFITRPQARQFVPVGILGCRVRPWKRTGLNTHSVYSRSALDLDIETRSIASSKRVHSFLSHLPPLHSPFLDLKIFPAVGNRTGNWECESSRSHFGR
jgi:hypothetical protein